MTDLVAFIEARLAEDEQWALAASQPYQHAAEGATIPPGGVHWTWVVGENWTPVTADPAVDDTVGGPEQYGCPVNIASVEQWSCNPWTMADGSTLANDRTMPRVVANQMVEVDSSAGGHIVRHDPARVLREVAAKRAILQRYVRASEVPPSVAGYVRGQDSGYTEACLDALRDLASAWSDHPEYRTEWA